MESMCNIFSALPVMDTAIVESGPITSVSCFTKKNTNRNTLNRITM